MTTISKQAGKDGAFRINGRLVFSGVVATIEKIAPGRWAGETVYDHKFQIEGGREAGGRPTDWFLTYEAIGGNAIICQSAMEAFATIDNC